MNRDILMARVARKVKDTRVRKLIRRYLQAGLMADGVVQAREEGTPQGGPLSPLLSNILLTGLDRELERRKWVTSQNANALLKPAAGLNGAPADDAQHIGPAVRQARYPVPRGVLGNKLN